MSRPLVALLNTDLSARGVLARALEINYDVIEFETLSDLTAEFQSLSYRVRVVVFCLNQHTRYTPEQMRSFIEINRLPDFIVMSEHHSESERSHYLAAGAASYIHDISTLGTVIEQTLALSRFRQKMEHSQILPFESGQLVSVIQDAAHEDLRTAARTAIDNGYSLFMKDIYHHFPQIRTLQIPSDTAIPSSLIDSSEKLQQFVSRCLCSANATT